jgi:hypothetical protein
MIETTSSPEIHSTRGWQCNSVMVPRGKELQTLPKLWNIQTGNTVSSINLPSEVITDLNVDGFTTFDNMPELAGLEINGNIYMWTTANPIFPSHNEVNRGLTNELSPSRVKFSIHYEYEPAQRSGNQLLPATLTQEVFIFFPPQLKKQQVENWYYQFLEPIVINFENSPLNVKKQIHFTVLETQDASK